MRRKAILVLLVSFFGIVVATAQEDMFKALFMYNFTKYLEWPTEYKNGDFVITVLGSSGIVSELEKIATKKKVENQNIVIKKANSPEDVAKSHIVYVVPSKSAQFSSLKTSLIATPTLIVTDKEGMAAQGACINYVKVDGKQKFEINPDAVQETGLKLNSALSALGIVVK